MISHKRSPSLHTYFICTDYDIYIILNTITYDDYILLLRIYYNDKHRIPNIFELYTITPEMFKIIHRPIDVSIDLEIYSIFITILTKLQYKFRVQIQFIFKISERQANYITDYFDVFASYDEIDRCKKAFVNSISKNIFKEIVNRRLSIIINRIEFSPNEFKGLINNKNKYAIYASKDIKEIYLKEYLQQPRKCKGEIEFIQIGDFVYRIDNLFK